MAGVLLGFTVPVLAGRSGTAGLAERFEHRMRPISAGFAVPVFAFFAAGVSFGGYDGFVTALRDPISLGVIGGLVVGKTIGVYGTTRLVAAVTRASLDSSLRWIDVLGVSLLAGVGFTVSLLIGDLAYESDPARREVVKVAVLTGSLLAAGLAAILLRIRNRHYRSVLELETADVDGDGVPDVYTVSPDRPGNGG